MGWTHHEVGKVDVGRMVNILQLARECGFSVPFSRPPPPPPRPAAAAAVAVTAAAAASEPSCVADGGIGTARATTTHIAVDSVNAGGSESARPPGRGVARVGRLGSLRGGGGCQVGLPRPDGVSMPPSEAGDGNGCVQASSLRPHLSLAAGAAGADCGSGDVGAGGDEAASEGRGQRQQGGEEKEWKGRGENSKRWMAESQRKSSIAEQADGQYGDRDFAGAGVIQTLRVGVVDGRVRVADRRASEGLQLQRQLPPAYCRVVVVGAGASGLSAAACLRARGEDRVVVLERWAGCPLNRYLPPGLNAFCFVGQFFLKAA